MTAIPQPFSTIRGSFEKGASSTRKRCRERNLEKRSPGKDTNGTVNDEWERVEYTLSLTHCSPLHDDTLKRRLQELALCLHSIFGSTVIQHCKQQTRYRSQWVASALTSATDPRTSARVATPSSSLCTDSLAGRGSSWSFYLLTLSCRFVYFRQTLGYHFASIFLMTVF